MASPINKIESQDTNYEDPEQWEGKKFKTRRKTVHPNEVHMKKRKQFGSAVSKTIE